MNFQRFSDELVDDRSALFAVAKPLEGFLDRLPVHPLRDTPCVQSGALCHERSPNDPIQVVGGEDGDGEIALELVHGW